MRPAHGDTLVSVYKPPLWREKKKKHPLSAATSYRAPPGPPSRRSRPRRRGCRPGAHQRGIFAPQHCTERQRDGGEEPRGGIRAQFDRYCRRTERRARPEMPPPALKGAHKDALPRALCAPGPRERGPQPAGRGCSGALDLGEARRPLPGGCGANDSLPEPLGLAQQRLPVAFAALDTWVQPRERGQEVLKDQTVHLTWGISKWFD